MMKETLKDLDLDLDGEDEDEEELTPE